MWDTSGQVVAVTILHRPAQRAAHRGGRDEPCVHGVAWVGPPHALAGTSLGLGLGLGFALGLGFGLGLG